MRYTLLVASLVLPSPLPALAQTETGNETKLPETCQELATQFSGTLDLNEDSTVEDTGTGCRIADFHIELDTMTRFRVEELVLTASDLFGSFADERLPEEMDLQLNNVLMAPNTGSPQTDYMIEAMAEPMNIHLAYRWDREDDSVDLADFSVATLGLGSFRFAGRFSDLELDPEKLSDAISLPVRIDQLVLEIDDARFFTSMFVPPLIGTLSYEEDPHTVVANYVAAATTFINATPADTIPDDSKAALVTFIESFPRFRGDYTLDIRAEPGLGFMDFAAEDITDLASLLPRIKVEATHTPEQP